MRSVTNGFILLGGLFLYDVFWVRTLPHKCPYMHCLMSILAQVFGTDVMVTVAKSFDAPIKRRERVSLSFLLAYRYSIVIFPMDILEHGIYAKNFSMLGLGDIVIPGIFIALLLRFEDRCGLGMRGRGISFANCFLFYVVGEAVGDREVGFISERRASPISSVSLRPFLSCISSMPLRYCVESAYSFTRNTFFLCSPFPPARVALSCARLSGRSVARCAGERRNGVAIEVSGRGGWTHTYA